LVQQFQSFVCRQRSSTPNTARLLQAYVPAVILDPALDVLARLAYACLYENPSVGPCRYSIN